MNVLYTVNVLFEHGNCILAAESKMTGIIKEIHKVRVGNFHEPVNFFGRLNSGTHVVMDGEVHTLLFRKATHFIESLCNKCPLFIGINRLFAKD